MRMIIFLGLLSSALVISSGCSSSAKTTPLDTPKAAANSEQPAFDINKPLNYSEYKRWRKLNDPAAEVYAEYKAWEAAYREWLEQQGKTAN